jgi:drug/metabolite transporter (DMT)-like permease
MWFWLLVIGGLFGSIRSLISRIIMRDEEESLIYTFIYQALLAVLMVPLCFLNLKLPSAPLSYFALILVGVVDSLAVYLLLESARLLELSLRIIISHSEMVWILILGALLLQESLGAFKALGVCLIFLGIGLASFKKERVGRLKSLWQRVWAKDKTFKEKGVILVLSATTLKASEKIIVKHLLQDFSPAFVAFIIRGVSALCLLLVIENLRPRAVGFLKRKGMLAFLHGFSGAAAFFFFLWATSMAEISRTLPITQGFSILTILGGIVFLKERERVWQKILGGILTAIGVILVRGS